MGILLLIVALFGILITGILAPITFVWIWIAYGLKEALKYYGDIALSIDQTGNVYLKEALNRWTTGKNVNEYHYGDEDDTISYVTAMNFYKGNSNKFGKGIGKLLDFAEKDHLKVPVLDIVVSLSTAIELLQTAQDDISHIEIPHYQATLRNYLYTLMRQGFSLFLSVTKIKDDYE